MDALESARRHHVDYQDMQHALENALLIEEIGDDPVRWLVLGPDRVGNLLELVVLDRARGPAFIHAMRMRTQYRRLLEGGQSR